MQRLEHTQTSLAGLFCLSIACMRIYACVELEEPTLEEISAVFDDSFLSELDESYFEAIPEPEADLATEVQTLKRKWDSSFSDLDEMSTSSADLSSDDFHLEEIEPISPAYDIENASLSPVKKRRRLINDCAEHDAKPTFSSWDVHSDDSWDALPAFEEVKTASAPDSWDMSPIKSSVSMPYTLSSPQSARNPIGNILSNGIHTTEGGSAAPKYACRACGKDLKGHQHTPTMHFMLPKHEKCWHRIAADADMSLETSKKLYPPQFMEKTAKKNEFACKKCGQRGSKRKILAHVMGAKCSKLRDEYSRAMAWNGIEEAHSA